MRKTEPSFKRSTWNEFVKLSPEFEAIKQALLARPTPPAVEARKSKVRETR